MSLILSGTDGLSDVDGSAATPAIRGTDANTGIFFPAADTIAFSEGGVEAVRIDSSGNVGIGTTSPSNKLVVSNAGAAGIELSISGTATLLSYNRSTSVYTDFGFNAQTFLFNTGSGGSSSERMRIDSSGNVGIGTASPSYKVQVNNAGQTNLYLFNSTDSVGLRMIADSAVGWVQTQTNHPLGFATNNTERMRIDTSGNLLVGTTAGAGAKIYVLASSTTGIRSDASTAGTVAIYGNHSSNTVTGYVAYFANTGASNGQYIANSGAWIAISDARLKTDIKNLDSTNRLMQLRPVDYLWKSQETSEEPSKRSLGFIAQEVKEVFPELVTVSPDGMFGVEYTGLISPLVKAIQEQQALIQSLTTRITALETP